MDRGHARCAMEASTRHPLLPLLFLLAFSVLWAPLQGFQDCLFVVFARLDPSRILLPPRSALPALHTRFRTPLVLQLVCRVHYSLTPDQERPVRVIACAMAATVATVQKAAMRVQPGSTRPHCASSWNCQRQPVEIFLHWFLSRFRPNRRSLQAFRLSRVQRWDR